MTEEQIIGALELKREMIDIGEEPSISIELITETLDLIQSKNAEIERITTPVFEFTRVELTEDEIKRYLRKPAKLSITPSDNTIRIEAIKEFADRLKNCFCISKEYLDIMSIIDNTLIEMEKELK